MAAGCDSHQMNDHQMFRGQNCKYVVRARYCYFVLPCILTIRENESQMLMLELLLDRALRPLFPIVEKSRDQLHHDDPITTPHGLEKKSNRTCVLATLPKSTRYVS